MNPSAPEVRVLDRSIPDLVVAVLLVVCGTTLFVTIDAVELLSPVVLRWEAAELDDLLLSLSLAVAVAGWFSFRRFRDSRTQVAALQISAEERARNMERLERLSSQLLEVEERERNRLADVLHDEIGQTLYACQLKLELLATGPRSDTAQLLSDARQLASAAMTRARDLSVQLNPPALQDLGIADALESLLARLEERYALKMQLVPGPAWDRISPAFFGPVFQSVAELAINAAKHATASEVVLSAVVEPSGKVQVVVADDGAGFDPPSSRQRGFGLFSVERRMACIDGALEIESSPSLGTKAVLVIPAEG